MPRLCERPGCSAVADVAYGFDRVARTVWLDRQGDDDVNRAGALCRRHADAMVVPLGWVLDDRREPVPRLFRAPGDVTGAQRRPRRRTAARGPAGDATVHQLRLDPPATPVTPAAPVAPVAPAAAHTHHASDPEAHDAVVVESDATSWIPRFDTADDVDGVLDARGPLLSRAFTGGRPTRPSR